MKKIMFNDRYGLTEEVTLVAQTFQLSVFRIDENIQIIIENYITGKPCTKIDL